MIVEMVTVPRYWIVSLAQLRLIADGMSHEAALDQARAEVSRMMDRSGPPRDAEVERLKYALKGGNALNDNAELLEFLADRLVLYGEKPNIDFIRAARERANMIRRALA